MSTVHSTPNHRAAAASKKTQPNNNTPSRATSSSWVSTAATGGTSSSTGTSRSTTPSRTTSSNALVQGPSFHQRRAAQTNHNNVAEVSNPVVGGGGNGGSGAAVAAVSVGPVPVLRMQQQTGGGSHLHSSSSAAQLHTPRATPGAAPNVLTPRSTNRHHHETSPRLLIIPPVAVQPPTASSISHSQDANHADGPLPLVSPQEDCYPTNRPSMKLETLASRCESTTTTSSTSALKKQTTELGAASSSSFPEEKDFNENNVHSPTTNDTSPPPLNGESTLLMRSGAEPSSTSSSWTADSVQFLFEQFYQAQQAVERRRAQQNHDHQDGDGNDEKTKKNAGHVEEDDDGDEQAAIAKLAQSFPAERIPQLLRDYHQCHREVQLLRKAVQVSNRIFSFLMQPAGTKDLHGAQKGGAPLTARTTPPRPVTSSSGLTPPSTARSPSVSVAASSSPAAEATAAAADPWYVVHQRQSEEYIARLIVLEKSVYILERQLQEQNRFHQAQREHLQQQQERLQKRQQQVLLQQQQQQQAKAPSSSSLLQEGDGMEVGVAGGVSSSSLEAYLNASSTNVWFREAMDLAERKGRQHGAEDLKDAHRKLSLLQDALHRTEELLCASQAECASARSALEELQQQQQQSLSAASSVPQLPPPQLQNSHPPSSSAETSSSVLPPWREMQDDIAMMRRQLSEVLDQQQRSLSTLFELNHNAGGGSGSSLPSNWVVTPAGSMQRVLLDPSQPQQVVAALESASAAASPSPARPREVNGERRQPLEADAVIVEVDELSPIVHRRPPQHHHHEGGAVGHSVVDVSYYNEAQEPAFAATSGAIALAVGVVAAVTFLNRSMSR